MDSLLKKQLAQIKARALMLRNHRIGIDDDAAGARSSAAANGIADSDGTVADASAGSHGSAADQIARSDSPAHTGPQSGNAIVEAVVDTGVVSRGADFVPRGQAKRRWPWQRPTETRSSVDDILARYKTGDPRTIDQVAPGVVHTMGDHTCYVITLRGSDVDPIALSEAQRFARVGAWPEHVSYGSTRRTVKRRRTRADDTGNPPFDPAGILFLDIETTGLSATTYVFLCGVMYFDARGGEWVSELVFARDYSEEAGLLLYVRDLMERFDTVVTYNGASFDLPFIHTRMAVHRAGVLPAIGAVDLLYTTRRVFRDILPNRRLTTVERHLRRVDREGDIPGRYIPDAYHDYVRTGDARVMHNVLYHNRMDLFTMAVIINHIAGV